MKSLKPLEELAGFRCRTCERQVSIQLAFLVFSPCFIKLTVAHGVNPQILTSETKYCTISGWSNMAAQWSGVIFCTSHEARHCIFSAGCMLNMSFTISIAPCAHARCTGVERSCCCVEILAPDLRHSSTAYQKNKYLYFMRKFYVGFSLLVKKNTSQLCVS